MSNPRIWNRKLHRWGAIAVALPFLVVVCTGILLQLKKQLPWVQPPEKKTANVAPQVSMDFVLESARQVPQAGVQSWSDVDRIDIRPGKGILKLISNSRWELQIDLGTGAVLQSTYRRSDLIESLHDGSWFHDLAKLWIFLPSGVVVLGLWVTGIYLWLLPWRTRARRTRTPPPTH
ncbi:MAG: PepSY domain-containing protein [Gemmatimonadetes bacterium]|nr:PepSY domain-containing protein [Gemmatimonadota bacterium]